MCQFPPVLEHGELVQVFDDVFTVSGAMRMDLESGTRRFSRNMVILREGDSLTLVNTMRLGEEGLRALDRLGSVRHIVKLGAFHGRDDAFYVDRYPDAQMWAPPGMPHGRGVETQRELLWESPTKDSAAVVFESPGSVEALLVVAREGGIVLSCDALQNWNGPDEYFDSRTAELMAPMLGRMRFGPGWLNKGKPTKADFRTLADLEFRHLLPAHGRVLLDDAQSALRERLANDRAMETQR